jgi:AraC-like DNA-binding protein
MNRSTYFIRAESLSGISELLNQYCIDPKPLYEATGLTAQSLENFDNVLPYSAVLKLLELASQVSQREDFGLQLTDFQKTLPLGVLGLLIQQCPDIKTALTTVIKYYRFHSKGNAWELQQDKKSAYLIRHDLLAGGIPSFQYISLSIAHALRGMKAIYGNPNWKPSYISFTHSAPSTPNLYENFFKLPIRFNQDIACLAFPVEDLERKIPHSNTDLQQVLQDKIIEFDKRDKTKNSFISTVGILIRQNLHTDECTMDNIAKLLAIHPKKLQRELKQSGTTFRELKADIKLDAAEHFIRESDLSLTIIAEMLGFSEVSALSRAFKSRHMVSPQDWRNHTR